MCPLLCHYESFSQPIQCRIDELVAGTRAQVIVKLFGDDTAVLKRKASEIAAVLSQVDGAADMVVERIAGQPYIGITVDREKVGRYGLNAGDVLHVVEDAKSLYVWTSAMNIRDEGLRDEVFYEHPKIQEACTIGIPDAKRGENVKLFVVLREGETATQEELLEYAKTKLATVGEGAVPWDEYIAALRRQTARTCGREMLMGRLAYGMSRIAYRRVTMSHKP
jgi:multidrug efflux pump subunit AcrB